MVFARRTASTLSLWVLVTAVFLSFRSWAVLGLMGILSTVATIEYFKMLRGAGVKCFPCYGLFLSIAYTIATGWFFMRGQAMLPSGIDSFAFFLAIAGPFALQLRRPIHGMEPLVSVAVNLLGFAYIPFLFGFAARITFMPHDPTGIPGIVGKPGAFLLLWLLAVTKFTDMGAYIVGSMIGKHKMIPHVSPGKTWEGFGGALLFAQIAACGLYALFPEYLSILHDWKHVIILGFILAVLAVIGDLAESIVKRSLNAKDSGKFLPGIGGSLDLLDSICFTAPALYFYLLWLTHHS